MAMETVMPKSDRKPKIPAFLESARAFYADAFEHTRKKDLVAAIDEWSEMEEGEQSFTVAHLLYLNLKGQAAIVRLLGDVRELLDEVAEGLDAALGEPEDDDEPDGVQGAGDAPAGVVDEPPVAVADESGSAPVADDQAVAPTAEVA